MISDVFLGSGDLAVVVDVRLLAVRSESCGGNGVVVGIKSETASDDPPIAEARLWGRPSFVVETSNQCWFLRQP
jgi:hypothetical protein